MRYPVIAMPIRPIIDRYATNYDHLNQHQALDRLNSILPPKYSNRVPLSLEDPIKQPIPNVLIIVVEKQKHQFPMLEELQLRVNQNKQPLKNRFKNRFNFNFKRL